MPCPEATSQDTSPDPTKRSCGTCSGSPTRTRWVRSNGTSSKLWHRHRLRNSRGAVPIRDLHRLWLGDIYPFAGELRTVNVSRGYVTFCPAANVPTELDRLDEEVLAQRTPCDGQSEEELAIALAVVHVEVIVIHPFREGNGRIGRWLATLMALQAGHAILDFENEMEGAGRDRYFQCLRRGFVGDYGPATELFAQILRRSS
jgi:cell filamentation protein